MLDDRVVVAESGIRTPDDVARLRAAGIDAVLVGETLMRAADVGPATAAILAADWGDRRSWFEFTLSHDTCHPFVAELDDRIVGSGVAIRSGRYSVGSSSGDSPISPPWLGSS